MSDILLNRIFQKGREFLKIEYPIICGAMTLVSDAKLVSSVSNAGGLGCLAGGNAAADELKNQIAETRDLTDKPIGVNVITIAPVYQDQLSVIKDTKPEFVIFAGGIPRKNEVEFVKSAGAKVLCFAANFIVGKRMVEYGADALILEGMEAGGHIGHITLSVLLQQVLFKMKDIPIFAGGGVATGRMCAHLLLMGAAGVQLGTRFAVSEESPAHNDFKKKYIKAKSRDAVAAQQFDTRLPISPVRAVKNKGTEDFAKLQLDLVNEINKGTVTREEAMFKLEEFWMGGLRKAVIDGDISHGSLMAGQSVGLVNEIMSVNDIISELVNDIDEELERVREIFI